MFKDRKEAGEKLAEKLVGIVDVKGVVLGIPRGGVVVARGVADKIGWSLGVVITKKIGVPGQEELAVGAMGEDGKIIWNKRLLRSLGLTKNDLKSQVREVRNKINNMKDFYYQDLLNKDDLLWKGKSVLLVDDGIATGQTVEAAIAWLKEGGAGQIVLAVPVCDADIAEGLKKKVDKFVCLETPEFFRAVGQFYEDFDQVSNKQVRKLLSRLRYMGNTSFG